VKLFKIDAYNAMRHVKTNIVMGGNVKINSIMIKEIKKIKKTDTSAWKII